MEETKTNDSPGKEEADKAVGKGGEETKKEGEDVDGGKNSNDDPEQSKSSNPSKRMTPLEKKQWRKANRTRK